jgi:two-component system LytT family response regulator
LSKIRCLIADDEELARRVIRDYLSEHDDIEIVGEAEDGQEALAKIAHLYPNLVLLDIQMPILNGFEVLDQLDMSPAIVFVTAHDEYAIKAFEVNAVDYLMKPCPKDRFEAALQRARESLASPPTVRRELRGRMQKLLEDVQRSTAYLDRLLIKEGSRITLLDLSCILWLQASDDYVTIHTLEGRSHLVTRSYRASRRDWTPEDSSGSIGLRL